MLTEISICYHFSLSGW